MKEKVIMKDINNVLDKVQKLLALAQSDNINEAALATKMAQKLMHKHNLTSYMVESYSPNQEEIIDFTQLGQPLAFFNKKASTWKVQLAIVVSQVNHCRIYINNAADGQSCFGLVGRMADAQIVRYLYHYLVSEIDRLTKRDGKGKGKTWSNNFRIGAVFAIQDRLEEAAQETIVEMTETSGASLAVRVNAIKKMKERGDSTQRWLEENLNLREGSKRSMNIDVEAQAAGRSAAKEINLDSGRGLGSGEQTKELRG